MTEEKLIKAAISGDYMMGTFPRYRSSSRLLIYEDCDKGACSKETKTVEQMLLDPAFFRAAGKSLGWNGEGKCECRIVEGIHHYQCPANSNYDGQYHQKKMIDALWEGSSVEEFIKTL